MRYIWEQEFEGNPTFKEYDFEDILRASTKPYNKGRFGDYLKHQIFSSLYQQSQSC